MFPDCKMSELCLCDILEEIRQNPLCIWVTLWVSSRECDSSASCQCVIAVCLSYFQTHQDGLCAMRWLFSRTSLFSRVFAITPQQQSWVFVKARGLGGVRDSVAHSGPSWVHCCWGSAWLSPPHRTPPVEQMWPWRISLSPSTRT